MINFEIVDYETSDQPKVKALNHEWLHKYDLWEPLDDLYLDHPEEKVLHKGGRILLAKVGSEIIGTAFVVPKGEGVAEVCKLCVAEAWQGKGIGKDLMQSAMKTAVELGNHTIELYSNYKLESAYKMYQKLGFKEVEEYGDQYAEADLKMVLHMNERQQATQLVYFFCMDDTKDEVAPRVYAACEAELQLETTEMVIDGYPVTRHTLSNGSRLYFVRTKTVLCMAFDQYIDAINGLFSKCDLGVLVNWHGVANAPDRVLCIHTVGDVLSGTFGPSAPKLSTQLARRLERFRIELGLDDFSVTSEATHWSGMVYGGESSWINDVTLPFLDVEIGSTPESYAHPGAISAIAKALCGIDDEGQYPVMVYCGGMHFEETITRAILHPTHPVALTHILPSRWIENEQYAGEVGKTRLKDCIQSIEGGIAGFVIHEKLAREQRETIAAFAEEINVFVVKRKALKTPETLPVYV